jgi:hypothetical protein
VCGHACVPHIHPSRLRSGALSSAGSPGSGHLRPPCSRRIPHCRGGSRAGPQGLVLRGLVCRGCRVGCCWSAPVYVRVREVLRSGLHCRSGCLGSQIDSLRRIRSPRPSSVRSVFGCCLCGRPRFLSPLASSSCLRT